MKISRYNVTNHVMVGVCKTPTSVPRERKTMITVCAAYKLVTVAANMNPLLPAPAYQKHPCCPELCLIFAFAQVSVGTASDLQTLTPKAWTS